MQHRLLFVCIPFVLQPIFFPEMGNFAKFSSKHEEEGFSLCTLYPTALHCLCLVDSKFSQDCSLYSSGCVFLFPCSVCVEFRPLSFFVCLVFPLYPIVLVSSAILGSCSFVYLSLGFFVLSSSVLWFVWMYS